MFGGKVLFVIINNYLICVLSKTQAEIIVVDLVLQLKNNLSQNLDLVQVQTLRTLSLGSKGIST